MKIGILGAMHEEVSCIKKLIQMSGETEIGSRKYFEGKLGNNEVVLSFSRWGKVASSCTTTTLINKFDVDFILFTGVAGAVSEQLNIGDIVISQALYQHDMDARPLFDQFQVPLTSNIVFEPRREDIINAANAAEAFVQTIENFIPAQLLSKFSILSPKVYQGMIASGDKFVSDPENHEELHFKYKGNETLAVEMEGAAVAQVCTEYGIPYIIIRTISDKADHSAAINFQAFIENIASKYASGIISSLLLPSFDPSINSLINS